VSTSYLPVLQLISVANSQAGGSKGSQHTEMELYMVYLLASQPMRTGDTLC
jgi:hypothetical protein